MSLYSKDVISERKRKDPRETDYNFEVIPEKESDFESDSDRKVDEEVPKVKQVRFLDTDDQVKSPGNLANSQILSTYKMNVFNDKELK